MLQYLMFVMLVIGGKGFYNIVMIQKMGRCACIFCKNEVDFFQQFQCPQRNIFQVTDGCWNEVEHECGNVEMWKCGNVEMWKYPCRKYYFHILTFSHLLINGYFKILHYRICQ